MTPTPQPDRPFPGWGQWVGGLCAVGGTWDPSLTPEAFLGLRPQPASPVTTIPATCGVGPPPPTPAPFPHSGGTMGALLHGCDTPAYLPLGPIGLPVNRRCLPCLPFINPFTLYSHQLWVEAHAVSGQCSVGGTTTFPIIDDQWDR